MAFVPWRLTEELSFFWGTVAVVFFALGLNLAMYFSSAEKISGELPTQWWLWGWITGILSCASYVTFAHRNTRSSKKKRFDYVGFQVKKLSPDEKLSPLAETYLARWKAHINSGNQQWNPKSMPKQYLDDCEGNLAEARAKWGKTLKWRRDWSVDDILLEQQPYFSTIKEVSPHFLHGRDKHGRPVYYDLLGRINVEAGCSRGLTVDRYIRHCIYAGEMLWNIFEPNDEQQMIAVMDVQGVGLQSLSGFALEIFQQQSKINAGHYPGRNFKTFIVNAPGWFSLIFPVILGALDRRTKENLTVLSRDYSPLYALIDRSEIPPQYGGTSTELGTSPEEQTLRRVAELNDARAAAAAAAAARGGASGAPPAGAAVGRALAGQ